MKRKIFLNNLTIALLSSLLLASAVSAQAQTMQLTPVIGQVVAGPIEPVQGSDGEYHTVYELQLTNVSPLPWRVDQLNALGNGKVLAELKSEGLKSRMGPLSGRGGSAELGPNQTAIVWMHLKSPSKKDLPEKIQHQLFLVGGEKSLEMAGPEVSVSAAQALAIAAPLKGERWLAGDGCCDSIRHVRALLPINGRLYAAQRFAIDWEKIGEGNKIYSGDSKDPENYYCYGQEVLAVADGVVTATLDGLPNQVPGKLPANMDLAKADGNHVILRIDPGHYALYAHLKPGSIRVKIGDRVQAGQVIAQVGNTGNTSEPHLHFHLMDGPSALTSNGIPYVIKSFEILGRVGSTAEFDKAAAEGTPLAIQHEKGAPTHQDQLPLDLSLVRFP